MTDEHLQDNTVMYQIATHMKETADRIEKKLDLNTEMTIALDKKVAIANGRTGKLEEYSNETKKTVEVLAKAIESNRDEISLMKETHKKDVQTVIWVITLCGFFLGLLVTILVRPHA